MSHDKATVWYTRFVSTTDSITAGLLEKGVLQLAVSYEEKEIDTTS